MKQLDKHSELHVLDQALFVFSQCVDSFRGRAERPGDASIRKATKHLTLALDCLTLAENGVAPWLETACHNMAEQQTDLLFTLTGEEIAALSADVPAEPRVTVPTVPDPAPKEPATAPTSRAPRKGLHGDTSSMSVSDLLSWLSLQERDGVLELQISGEDVIIYLQKGNVVHAESNNSPPNSRLGEILVDQGALTDEQLNDLVYELSSTRLSIGALARSKGMIDQPGLHAALSEQISRLFTRLFRAEEATFSLVEGLPRNEDGILQLSTMGLLLDAARCSDEALMHAAGAEAPKSRPRQ